MKDMDTHTPYPGTYYHSLSKILDVENFHALPDCLNHILHSDCLPIELHLYEIKEDLDFHKVYESGNALGIDTQRIYQKAIDDTFFAKALKEKNLTECPFEHVTGQSGVMLLQPIMHNNRHLGMITCYMLESPKENTIPHNYILLLLKILTQILPRFFTSAPSASFISDKLLIEFLNAFSSHSDDFWFLIDSQFRIHYANPRASDEFDELIHTNLSSSFLELIHGPFIHHFQKSNAEMLLTGQIKNKDLLMQNSKGEEIPVIYNGTVLKQYSREHVLILMTARDSRPVRSLIQGLENSRYVLETQNERLEEKINERTQELYTHLENFKNLNQIQNSILESIDSGILRLNSNLEVELFNSRLLRILKLDSIPIQIPLGDISVLSPFGTLCEKVKQSKKALNGLEIEIRTPEKQSIFLSFSVSPLFSPLKSLQGILIVLNDITEIKRIHKQLIQNERLGALGKMMVSIAHEIRNPLNVIRGLSEMALHKQLDSEKSKVYSEKIIRQIDRLEVLLKEMLDYIKDRPLNRTPIEFNHFCAAVYQTFTDTFPGWCSKNICFSFKPTPYEILVSLDQNQIEQVLLNLIKNSVEAIENNGSIELAIFKNEEHYGVAVSDNGMGIEDSQIENIFEPFFTTKLPKGTGLGLAIVKNIIEAHGGVISVASQLKSGTTFTLSFPLLEKENIS